MAPILVPAALFAGSLAVLILSSRRFTSAVERIGLSLGVSPFIIGGTVVAGGTSLPELTSSVVAVLEGEPAVVAGTVVGSNVANILLALGVVAVASGRIRVDRELMRVDLPLLVASAVFLLVAVWNTPFDWYEGVLALCGLAVYVHFALSTDERLDDIAEELVEEHAGADTGDLARTAAGTRAGPGTYALAALALLLVFAAADQLVASLLAIAATLDVGTAVVAVTAVGIGTSLPEVVISLAAVRQHNAEIAVGNVLGSNIFNTFAVMGIPSLIGPVVVPEELRSFALPVMVLATLLYYFTIQDRTITRWEGAALLLLYAVFLLNVLTG
jgi:cation:H+ antiporter